MLAQQALGVSTGDVYSMSRLFSVHVCDTTNKDLLGGAQIVEVDALDSFHDVFNGLELPGRTLLVLKLRPLANSTDVDCVTLKSTLLDKSLADIDTMLLRMQKPEATIAHLTVSTQAAAAHRPVQIENGLSLLQARGQAAYGRISYVTAADVSKSFASTTAKGKLAQRLQERLVRLAAGFRSLEPETLRMRVFTAVNDVLWRVPPKLAKSFEPDKCKLSAEHKAALCEIEDLLGAHDSKFGDAASLEGMRAHCAAAVQAVWKLDANALKCVACICSCCRGCLQPEQTLHALHLSSYQRLTCLEARKRCQTAWPLI